MDTNKNPNCIKSHEQNIMRENKPQLYRSETSTLTTVKETCRSVRLATLRSKTPNVTQDIENLITIGVTINNP